MDKIYVVYWSGTGNTKVMAECIKEGIEAAGKEAVLQTVSEASIDELKKASVFALGCSSQGAEVLEEAEMEPFMAELEAHIGGKNIALFGSYGWGDGEWMRNWVDRVNAAGANVIGGEGLMANEAPDDDAQEACRAFGKQIAAQ